MDTNSKKNQTLFPLPNVSDHDFNLFHTIDRELYARLVLNLGRDPGESVQVMAFWLWLERETNDAKLIQRLLSLPSLLLNQLTEETRLCLMCLDSDKFRYNGEIGEITLLPEVMNSPVISLRFFYENRVAVSKNVEKIVSSVCIRAFRDIPDRIRVRNAAGGGNVVEVGESSREAERRVVGPTTVVPPMMFSHVPICHPAVGGGLFQMPTSPGLVNAMGMGMGRLSPIQMGGFSSFDLVEQQHHMLNSDLGEMVGRNVNVNVNRDENLVPRSLPADDRTIFLTFSKGYPTTEDEVKEYFTRRFGDFIQDLILQEVGEDEQVLYARMVVKASAVGVIEEIVGRGNKAKFTINGKHVWARKYVKMSRSPPRGGRSGGANSGSQTATP